jgi:hypothetical protein
MTNVITNSGFWPDGIRLVISVSMQFEAGGQPPKGTDSPFPKGDFPRACRPMLPPTHGSLMAIAKVFRECWTCGIAMA